MCHGDKQPVSALDRKSRGCSVLGGGAVRTEADQDGTRRGISLVDVWSVTRQSAGQPESSGILTKQAWGSRAWKGQREGAGPQDGPAAS